MNEDAFVVNLFFTVRVFVVGAYMFIYPRISRKGLLFGTYVGEAVAEGDAARSLRRSWDRGSMMLMALALVVGYSISLSGHPVRGNLTGTVVLLSTAPLLYVWMYRKARHLAPPATERQTKVSAAPLSVDESKGAGLAKLAVAVCILAGLATATYVTLRYEDLPDRVPTLSNILGVTEEFGNRSVVAALFFPTLNLVLSSSFALMGLLMVRAKRSVRGGTGGRSAEAQDAFRKAMVQLFSGTALFTCLLVTLLSVQIIRIQGSQAESLGASLGWASAAMVLYMLVSLIRIMKCYGQGGALLEEGSVEAPLTGGLADNTHWIWGVIYVDKDDPSILVECRFGIGYTMNLGNRTAVLFLGTYLVLLFSLVVVAVTGSIF